MQFPKKDTSTKPQKPLQAYNLFCNERIETIKKQNPDKDESAIRKLLSVEWKNLSQEKKQVI